MKDKISIIIPVYNTEKYLERCVNSVVNQTHQNLEIILVDDGSPDGSGALCDKLKEKDERIVVIHKSNGGLSSARNAGIAAATGSYLGFVDSDDWVEPDMYEHMLHIMKEYGVDLVRSGIRRDANYCLENHNHTYSVEILNKQEAAQTVWENGFMCNKLFKTSIFKMDPSLEFDEAVRYVEDQPVLLRYIVRIEKLADTTKLCYHYYENPNSISGVGFNLSRLTALYGFRDMCTVAAESIPEVKDDYESKYYSILIGFYRQSEVRKSKEHKKRLQTEIRNSFSHILALKRMTMKFKIAALIYSMI